MMACTWLEWATLEVWQTNPVMLPLVIRRLRPEPKNPNAVALGKLGQSQS